METKILKCGDMEWRYYTAGTGNEGFLFLAGMLSAGPSIAEFLSAAFPEKLVMVPAHAAVSTVSECINAIRLMLDRENISQTVVYGASFGSLIAQCFARSDVHRVRHLILSGAARPELSRARANQRWIKVIPFLPLSIIKMGLLVALKSVLKSSVWLREYRHLIKNINKDDLISRYKIAIDYDRNYCFQREDFQNSSIRILIIEGEADRVAGKKVREKLRALYPDAAVHTFPQAGHSVLLTHPEEWKKVVTNFIFQTFPSRPDAA